MKQLPFVPYLSSGSLLKHLSKQCYLHSNLYEKVPFAISTQTASKLVELMGRSETLYRRFTTLKIWPAAHELPLLEHIVLTALIVERWRMSERLIGKLKWAFSRH
jgi:hypothetical protein